MSTGPWSSADSGWFQKVFWSIGDQGLAAVASLAVNFSLARWLPATSYGAFTIGQSVLLFATSLHSAWLSEPLMIFGAHQGRDERRLYVAAIMQAHLGFSVLMTVMLGLAGVVAGRCGEPALTAAFYSLALSGSFVPLLTLARRACYVDLRPWTAATGSALYFALIVASGAALYRSQRLSIMTSTVAIGASSLLASLWLLYRLELLEWPRLHKAVRLRLLAPHWRIGRWAVPSSGLAWLPNNGALVLLPFWSGLEASAALRVLLMMMMPAVQVSYAIGQMLLPTFVQARAAGDLPRKLKYAISGLTLVSLLYAVVVWLFGALLLHLLFGGVYDAYGAHLAPLALFPVVCSAAVVLQAVLSAYELPRAVFASYAASALFILLFGVPTIRAWGVGGAVFAHLGGYVVLTLAMLRLLPNALRGRQTNL